MVEKLVLFAVVSLTFGLPQYVRAATVSTFGFGNFPFLRLYFLVLPACFVLAFRILPGRGARLPAVAALGSLTVAYLFVELWHAEGPDVLSSFWAADFGFITREWYIVLLYLVLVNLGTQEAYLMRALDYGIACGVGVALLTLLGLFGILNLNFSFFDDYGLVLSTRPVDRDLLFHPNVISYQCAFTLALYLLRQRRAGAGESRYLLGRLAVFGLLLAVITLNATRGAFLLALVLVAVYLANAWRSEMERRRALAANFLVVPALCGLILLVYGIFTVGPESSIFIVNRFETLDGTELRIVNIRNCWDNFKEHPFLGVGYERAAKSAFDGTRSNTLYLQLLATGGLFLFPFWSFYLARLLFYRKDRLARSGVIFTSVCVASMLLFKRPDEVYALAAYFAYANRPH